MKKCCFSQFIDDALQLNSSCHFRTTNTIESQTYLQFCHNWFESIFNLAHSNIFHLFWTLDIVHFGFSDRENDIHNKTHSLPYVNTIQQLWFIRFACVLVTRVRRNFFFHSYQLNTDTDIPREYTYSDVLWLYIESIYVYRLYTESLYTHNMPSLDIYFKVKWQ